MAPSANLGQFGALWRPPMAIPDPENGPNTSPWMCPALIQPWSTLIHPFVAARVAYGHKRTIYGYFGQFLAIKWVKMAGSRVAPIGSRSNSTPLSIFNHWFSQNSNFAQPPPPLTHCGESLGTTLRKTPFQMIARIYWIFLLREAFLWHGLIHPHAGAYICKNHNIWPRFPSSIHYFPTVIY